ncbi:LacI family transcriptional regulator [Candidatus Aerophobetes bacterium Ae_b3a]|nr:MAG: LacI family transcriptional regulator [Candidatus Aerophobetes bacterium Ae_b3a]
MSHVTLRDIAKKADVSATTVSRALNNKPDVSSKTKDKILRIAKNLGYTSNLLAKSLRSRKSKTIGVVLTDISNPFFAAIAKGIESAAHKRGYSIILCNTDEKYEKEEEALQVLVEKRVDGLLITPVQKEYQDILRIKERRIPLVSIARHFDTIETDSVVSDDVLGGFLATEYLIKKGHKRILYISGPLHVSSASERLKGYKRALKKYKIPFKEKLVRGYTAKMGKAYTLTRRILKEKLDFTAIFTFSDFLALGVMKAIREEKLKIPDDVAIVGYDDIEFASALEIPLTTVHMPKYRLGTEGTNMLIDEIEGRSTHRKPQKLVFKPELIARKSA